MTAGADIGKKAVIDLSADKIEGIILQDIQDQSDEDNKSIILRQAIFESKYDQI